MTVNRRAILTDGLAPSISRWCRAADGYLSAKWLSRIGRGMSWATRTATYRTWTDKTVEYIGQSVQTGTPVSTMPVTAQMWAQTFTIDHECVHHGITVRAKVDGGGPEGALAAIAMSIAAVGGSGPIADGGIANDDWSRDSDGIETARVRWTQGALTLPAGQYTWYAYGNNTLNDLTIKPVRDTTAPYAGGQGYWSDAGGAGTPLPDAGLVAGDGVNTNIDWWFLSHESKGRYWHTKF